MKSLRIAVQEYLKLRQQLGFKLIEAKRVLMNFVDFMKKRGASYVTTNLALEFATKNQKASPASWAAILGIIRQFTLYWSAIDSRTQIPPPKILPHSYRRKSPYIYSDDEIVKLLQCCNNMHTKHELCPHTYFTLFGLLVTTGMRIGEALTLECESVDLKNGIITICDSKSQNARHIPLHHSTTEVLQNYVKHRNRCFPATQASFFL